MFKFYVLLQVACLLLAAALLMWQERKSSFIIKGSIEQVIPIDVQEQYGRFPNADKMSDKVNFGNIAAVLMSKVHQKIIRQERQSVKEEMAEFFNQTLLNASLIEAGGQPQRSIIVTTWRSGSSFLGSLLECAPATFYYNEPFNYLFTEQIRDAVSSSRHMRQLEGMLNCDYSDLGDYVKFAGVSPFVFDTNSRLGKYCQDEARTTVCANKDFLGNFCKLFPFQAMKICRIRLKLLKPFLEEKRYNLKVLYLVRDPRATMKSRRDEACTGAPDCDSPFVLCTDLEHDFHAAQEFLHAYPDQFRIVRFEELALDPLKVVQGIYVFLDLKFHGRIKEFLLNHTTQERQGHLSLHHVSKDVPFRWITTSNFSEVQEIQEQCSRSIQLWGYNLADNSTHFKTFNPVNSPPLGSIC